jgi:hypothetical protein
MLAKARRLRVSCAEAKLRDSERQARGQHGNQHFHVAHLAAGYPRSRIEQHDGPQKALRSVKDRAAAL